ncbi:MAG: XRE family transcriptional regulator [Alphaproteobacteria bacterium PRO2]|nr:XRE family transcriptional regulator [Alphaproteobacteria bacterium PRO2]
MEEIKSAVEFGNFLKELREKSGQSLEDASAAFGTKNFILLKIEEGKTLPHKTLCGKISDNYGLPPGKLFETVCALVRKNPKNPAAQFMEVLDRLQQDVVDEKLAIEDALEVLAEWEILEAEMEELGKLPPPRTDSLDPFP